jgi:hypothetical protein
MVMTWQITTFNPVKYTIHLRDHHGYCYQHTSQYKPEPTQNNLRRVGTATPDGAGWQALGEI